MIRLSTKTLKKLHLHFNECTSIEDVQFSNIISSIPNDLEELTLGFYKCPIMRDDSFICIGNILNKNLNYKSKLRELDLSFDWLKHLYGHTKVIENTLKLANPSLNKVYINSNDDAREKGKDLEIEPTLHISVMESLFVDELSYENV
jgi:hypothetical protein